MAFDRTLFANNSMGAGNEAPSNFSYKGSTNTKAEVIADDFFNEVADRLLVDDMIYSSTSDTAPVILYVVSISATNEVVTGYPLVA
tara:strand:+ start:699 stop:956 length:258 start_codon:yes stop_codon:yes gene_type:complete